VYCKRLDKKAMYLATVLGDKGTKRNLKSLQKSTEVFKYVIWNQ
jgi:hypothetical protein